MQPHDTRTRCEWATTGDPLYIAYHDSEWGVPVHEDRLLLEMLILGGAQAGLSWATILKKRDQYRRAFDHFDAQKIASYGDRKITELLGNPGIIRNRQKIQAAIRNARGFLAIQEAYGSFHTYIWRFVDGVPQINRWRSMRELPATSPESEAMSKDLKKHGFSFVGPTICYAFMQSVGMVNDHTVDCFRYQELCL